MHDLLSGLRVIEMGHIVLGPLAGQMLADYGADVIKVESLGGDLYRANGVSRNVGMTAQWMSCNRNKRSLALDLKAPAGREVLRELLASANAFLHNMRPPAIKRLGFDYDNVKVMNPSIVYCFSGGFGQDGPYADFPAFDDIIQAYSGLASVNGVQTGQPEFVPMVVCDTLTGLSLGQALLAGLLRQQMRGEGVCIEVPMYETVVNAVMNQHLGGHAYEPPEAGLGYKRVMDPSRRPCRTMDGYLVHGVYKLDNWRKLFEALDRQDLLESEMLETPQAVAAHIGTLYRIMYEEIMPTRTSAQWMTLFDQLDIPYGRVQDLDELMVDPHLQAVGLFEEFDHPSEGRMREVRQPVAVTGVAKQGNRPAPRLGQHSREVLESFDFSSERIDALRAAGVISEAPSL
ncbi:MAG: CoA transferase [Gammaproteobacteria bacterium]|nr:CoA transferase [Gammaproteobacteria bacterium]